MKPALHAALAAIVLTTSAHAAVVLYDFESYTDSQNLNGVDGWTVGRTNTAATATSGGLSYTGGSITINGGNRKLSLAMPAGDAANALTNAFSLSGQGDGSTVYFSFLYQTSNVTNGFSISGLNDGGDMRTSSAVLTERTPDQARLYETATVGNTATNLASGSLPTNTTTLVVGRVQFSASGNETLSMIINPTSSVEATAFASATNVSRNIGVTSFDQFGVFASANNQGTALYDEIRIANTYSEVIPEPASAFLFVLGLGMTAVMRRRGHE